MIFNWEPLHENTAQVEVVELLLLHIFVYYQEWHVRIGQGRLFFLLHLLHSSGDTN